MKLLIRTFSLIMIFLILLFIIIYFNNTNFIINEMHNASYIAIEEVMNKKINYLSGETNENVDISSELYSSFSSLVKNVNRYDVDIKSDDEGIVKLSVKAKNNKFIRDINLICLIEDLINKKEVDGYDEFDINSFLTKSRLDNVLYEKEFEEPRLLKSFYIDIEAYTASNNYSVYNRYEPEMTITLIDEDDNKITYKKDPVIGKKTLDEVNFDSDNYDFEEMYVKYVKLQMKAVPINASPKADLLRIGSTGKNYFEYEGGISQDHLMYPRYIDDNYLPPSNSKWNQNEYKNILEGFINA